MTLAWRIASSRSKSRKRGYPSWLPRVNGHLPPAPSPLKVGLPKLSKPYLQGLVKRRNLQFIIRSISRALFVTASTTTLDLFDLPTNFIHLQHLAISDNIDKRVMLLSEMPQEFKRLSFFALLMWSQSNYPVFTTKLKLFMVGELAFIANKVRH